MYKWLVILLFVAGIIISGCSNNGLSGERPPEAKIEVGNNTYETTLGTYCWEGNNQGICVDSAGPQVVLEGEEPIKVNPSETITFVMDYQPKPDETHVTQISDNNKEVEIHVEDNQFAAPMEKGVYYYSYGVWWRVNGEESATKGDAFYYFVIEVE